MASRNVAARTTEGASASTSAARTSIVSLPMEVLQEILARVVRDAGGAVPTAPRLTCVSRAFRDAVTGEPEMFWVDVDLSSGFCAPTDARIRSLINRGAWGSVRSLNLSGCSKLSDSTLKLLGTSCAKIENLTISGGNFTKDGLMQFADNLAIAGAGLKSIHIDLSAPKMTPSDALGALQHFVEVNAPTLERISCGREAPYAPAERRAFTKGSNRLFDLIKLCTGLKVLDLTNCGEDARLPLFDLQRALPHLEELKLNHFGGEPGWRVVGRISPDFEETCWRNLRVLEVAVSLETTSVGHRYGNSNVDGETLFCILFNSIECLEVLDVTGCTHLGDWRDTIWDRLPFNLRTLRCARTPLVDDGAVRHILSHLCPALEELELASVGANAQHITDEAFTPFTPGSGPPLALTTLRIPGSAVSEASVRLLCDDVAADARFPRLRSLDLASCRALPRDIRRVALETFPRPNVDHLRRALGM
jgi:hypothetical protein